MVTIIALLCCLALLGAGCGSSDSSTSTAAPADKTPPSIAAEESEAADQSIQHYGSEAKGSEKEAVVTAMRAFLHAMAASDEAEICAGLTSSNRSQLQQFAKLKHEDAKNCAQALAGVLAPGASPQAKKAAAGTISKVRIGNGNAFVLFRPAGGQLSYFVAKREGDEWKATSLAAGTPLQP